MSPLRRSILKITHKTGGLLVLVFFLTACKQSAAVRPPDMAGRAAEFVRLYALNKLSVNAARELSGSESSAERVGAFWQIRSGNGNEEMVLRAENLEESTDDAEMRLKLEAGLKLGDLENAFGAWQLVFASVTSSVSFRIVDRPDKSTLVFVRLFTPKPSSDSPVLSMQLRRDDGAAGKKSQ